jgi:hypothetical protein
MCRSAVAGEPRSEPIAAGAGPSRSGLQWSTRRSLALKEEPERPLGSDTFLSKVEVALGQRVRALSVGRPRRLVEEGGNR